MSESSAGPPLVLISGPDGDGVAVITLNRQRARDLARQVSRAPREVLVRNKAKFIARSAISPQTPTLDL